MDKDKGSFTVEATFLLIISVSVIMIILYAAMYEYDRTILQLVCGYELTCHSYEKERFTEEAVCLDVKEKLADKLYITEITNVSAGKGWIENSVKVKFDLNIPSGFLKQKMLGESGYGVCEFQCSAFRQAYILWDYLALKGEKQDGGTDGDKKD